jgi:hypothetical protein
MMLASSVRSRVRQVTRSVSAGALGPRVVAITFATAGSSARAATRAPPIPPRPPTTSAWSGRPNEVRRGGREV